MIQIIDVKHIDDTNYKQGSKLQILSLGAVDKTYNSMCELKQCIHYPMKQIAMTSHC
ncbi:hypothetical protein DAPPUDRAFT_248334 [Daphnia pulex]|uniref:Uncharacterized protein n=1 Tax=Daphnia pulex TaxID=6669 RepID=E9GU70_DAPPU|nr:hypothetical protein DAPPUDRAFT_248334 [Daphnia pulex]|eukprot:EFX77023.1 hypothetical protein DAPPUDRAFT_248334 [Daphnia pulex]